ncbi:signal transduction protein [Photobacterium rosenbergii]|uniref:Signal transduction protein n=1 Tax=Photobacterium rosenbergii TaxID=294936 RepID=A0A2T3N9N6_9GAMM|nr:signal transduction protein [Photobacterium rosenbergii]PSW10251.1 signal transduction protein [Photobacterium rosenbergii]
MSALTLQLPQAQTPKSLAEREVFVIANGDLRDSANQNCWPVQAKFEAKLANVLETQFGYRMRRAHPVKESGHGFISSQREGSDIIAGIDPTAPIIVLMTAWQYSHHIAPSLVHHKGPVLLLANFDGTWPGLVGALCMAGTLNSLGKTYSRLWSENFDDDFFYTGLQTWLECGELKHDTSYLQEITKDHPVMQTVAGQQGQQVGEHILKNKEIMGLFDMFCMGMMNGVFPQESLAKVGMPIEALSQSALLHEMSLVPQAMKEACLQWYIDKGMTFNFGEDPAVELTREQVLEQCAMLIAMVKFTDRFGLTSVGVQYQQGLKDCCPASDFAEGAIGSSERFPISNDHGEVIQPGKPIPCINEVDMGTAIPQTMLYRLLDSFNLPSETTLHDIRWGSEYEGTFYWDFEISGSVPFEHIKGGIAGAIGHRQPPMFFPLGGSTVSGQCKAGRFIWARAHYEGTDVHMHIGTGTAFELPHEEFHRRLNSTNKEWPLMNCVLDGVGRDDLMAGHQSNHISVAYVPEQDIDNVVKAFVAQSLTQNMRVHVAGGINLD